MIFFFISVREEMRQREGGGREREKIERDMICFSLIYAFSG